jgi:hypothetical protein
MFVLISAPDSFSQRSKFKLSRTGKYNVTEYSWKEKSTGHAWLKGFKPKLVSQDFINITKLEIENDNVENSVTGSKPKVLVVNKAIVEAEGEPPTVNLENNENLGQVLRMRREDNERRYYTLRKNKVNPIDNDFIITGAQICSTDANYMTILIVVPSIPSHHFVRDAIRATYGTYAKERFFLQQVGVEVTIRLMFLVGKDGLSASEKIIKNESRTYGDIVYADFNESYRNLTRKMLIALKWISVYCSDVDFVMKADEDVFVNIPQLAKDLHQRPYGIKGSIYGYINVQATVRRVGKWGVTKDEFPLTHYPNYASGNSYVISGNIIPRMFMVSEYLPYMPIEDAFITGCLTRIVEANIVSVPGFTYWNDAVPDPCQFVRDRRISATKVSTSIMLKLWKVSNLYEKYCKPF